MDLVCIFNGLIEVKKLTLENTFTIVYNFKDFNSLTRNIKLYLILIFLSFYYQFLIYN